MSQSNEKHHIYRLKVGQPAIRALESIGITYLEDLINYSEKDLLELHGFGKKGLDILKANLSEMGLALKS